MSAWEEFSMVVGMMVVTFGVRYPVLALAGRISLPPLIKQALQFVPVAVLTAISMPLLLKPEGQLWVSTDNEYLVAGVLAVVVAAWSRHLLLTIVLGMATFVFLRLF